MQLILHVYLRVAEDFMLMFSGPTCLHPVLNFSSTFRVKRIGQRVISPGPEQHNFICKARHRE